MRQLLSGVRGKVRQLLSGVRGGVRARVGVRARARAMAGGGGLLCELRPRGDHEAVAVVRQPLPELLGDVGHEGVQQPQAGVEHVHQRAPRLARARLRLSGHG